MESTKHVETFCVRTQAQTKL